MSVYLMSEIWQGVDLPTNLKMVMLKLADHADDDGSNAWPSIGRLAHDCGLSERSVYRILQQLQGRDKAKQQDPERDGIIVAEANEGGGRGKSVSYKIDIEKAKRRYPLAPYQSAHRKSCPVAPHEKGANVAPFSKNENPDTGDKNPDTGDTKTLTLVSPQPSYESSKESSSPPLLIPPHENQSGTGSKKAHDTTWLIDLADWQPDEPDYRYAQERGLDPDRILADIRDWAVNAAPRQQRKRDPHAFWRGWCRREADRLRSPPGANGGGTGRSPTAIRDAARRVAARRS